MALNNKKERINKISQVIIRLSFILSVIISVSVLEALEVKFVVRCLLRLHNKVLKRKARDQKRGERIQKDEKETKENGTKDYSNSISAN